MENYSTLKHYATPSDYKIIESLGVEVLFDIACEYYESDCVPSDTIKALIRARVNGIIDMYTEDLIMRIVKVVMKYRKEHKTDE